MKYLKSFNESNDVSGIDEIRLCFENIIDAGENFDINLLDSSLDGNIPIGTFEIAIFKKDKSKFMYNDILYKELKESSNRIISWGYKLRRVSFLTDRNFSTVRYDSVVNFPNDKDVVFKRVNNYGEPDGIFSRVEINSIIIYLTK